MKKNLLLTICFAAIVGSAAAQNYCDTGLFAIGCNNGLNMTITDVTLATINYHNNSCVSTTSLGYSLDSTTNPLLICGNAYVLSITTSNTYFEGAAAWIDYNRNGLFTDAGETVITPAYHGSAPATYTDTVVIPLTATPGQTLLRCRSNYANPPLGPCAVQQYGQVIDFVVTISCITGIDEPRKNEVSVSPNPFSSSFTVKTGRPLTNAHMSVYNVLGKEVYSANAEIASSFLLAMTPDVPEGIYFLEVVTDEGAEVVRLVKM